MTTIMTCTPLETFRIEYVDDVKRAVKIMERALAEGSTEVTAEWIDGAWKVVYKKPNGMDDEKDLKDGEEYRAGR